METMGDFYTDHDDNGVTRTTEPDGGDGPEVLTEFGPNVNPKFETQQPPQIPDGTIELAKMSLQDIPPAVFKYRHYLKILYLQDNDLQTLPEYFFDDFPHLAWCDLRFNSIKALPEFTKPHDSLRVLMMQDNQLSSIPYSFGVYATKVKTLGLRGNPLHDPPMDVIAAGVEAIRYYLVQSLRKEQKESTSYSHETKRSPQDNRRRSSRGSRKGFSMDCSPQISGRAETPDFTEALYKSLQRAKKYQARQATPRSQNALSTMDKKSAAKCKYTWDVWRDVPYDGKEQKDIINRSLEDMRNHVMRKFNVQKDRLLQIIKDREVLQKWRFETRCLQKAGRRPGTCCLLNPPYGVSSDVLDDEDHCPMDNLKLMNLSMEDFQKEVSNCTQRLQEFMENPISLSDSNAALCRLNEVEEIQKKLCSIKLGGSNPIPS